MRWTVKERKVAPAVSLPRPESPDVVFPDFDR